jgi:hypothetical protein
LAQLLQILIVISATQSLWNDVINVHLTFGFTTLLAASISQQYAFPNLAPSFAAAIHPGF